MTTLAIENLSRHFGGVAAVSDVNMQVPSGKITGLIGPNGAGKTTLINLITGMLAVSSGTIRFGTHDLTRAPAFMVARAGIARTFQNIRLFPGMTALENLMVAQHNALMLASGLTFLGLIGAPSWRSAEKRAIDQATRWLARIGLLDRADDAAGNLPYGDQRRLDAGTVTSRA